MGRSKASPWIAGTVVLSLVILTMAWFLAISPSLDGAAQARADAEQARGQNVVQAQKLATLQQQYAELDVYRAQLAEIRTRIPTEAGLPDLMREFDARAFTTGVTVVSLAPGLPQEFYPAAPAESAPEPAVEEGAEGSEDAAEETGPPTPTGPIMLDGFVAVPLQVTVLGGYDAVAAFVKSVQEDLDRLYVVTSFEIAGQDEAEASNGRPATAEGDAEMIINGYVYVLDDRSSPSPTGSTPETVEDADEAITS